MSLVSQLIGVVVTASIIVALIFLATLLPHGEREHSQLENVHGIPYPHINDWIRVSESLAHFDVYLAEPVLAKQLVLRFEYIPDPQHTLRVGVRQDAFWLSYAPVSFSQPADVGTSDSRTAEISIPLTDKLQETDRSIDVMFLTDANHEKTLQHPLDDTTSWQIRNIRTSVTYARPTYAALKDYVRSITYQERAL